MCIYRQTTLKKKCFRKVCNFKILKQRNNLLKKIRLIPICDSSYFWSSQHEEKTYPNNFVVSKFLKKRKSLEKKTYPNNFDFLKFRVLWQANVKNYFI